MRTKNPHTLAVSLSAGSLVGIFTTIALAGITDVTAAVCAVFFLVAMVTSIVANRKVHRG